MPSTPSLFATKNTFLNIATRLGIPDALIDFIIWQLLCDLRVALPGIIQSYNAENNTAVVQVAIKENININLVSTPTAIHPLVDVPVIFPGNSQFAITFPIQAGDEVLLVFCDNCYNAWWANGGTQTQEEKRRHDLSDAVAIVGLRSQPNNLTNISTSALQIRNAAGTSFIQMDESGDITITAARNLIMTGANEAILSGGTSGGTTNIAGINFLNHEHTGVQSGGSNTGPVA